MLNPVSSRVRELNDCKILCPVPRFSDSSDEGTFLLITFILAMCDSQSNSEIKHYSLDLPK